jgi:glycine/D-amino acid oxidase-like deaminating enzyme
MPMALFFDMKSIESEIVILGGGCAALWVSYEMARRGWAPLVIEHGSLARFASQRNQGWLHSGSLYAVITSENPSGNEELIRLARTCLRSSSHLKGFARRQAAGAFYQKSRCLYLYMNEEGADRAAERLREIGLEPRVFRGDLSTIEPILRDSPVRVAVEAPDIPMDCGNLLRSVLRTSLAHGTRMHESTVPLESWQVHRSGNKWILKNEETEVACGILIMAVGPLICKIAQHENLFQESLPGLQRATVGVIDKRICRDILVFRDPETGYLNLTPFPGLTTINLGAKDEHVRDCEESGPNQEQIRLIEEMLSLYCPGIEAIPNSVRATFYQCHKVSNNIPGSHPAARTATRHYFWRTDRDRQGLFYIYPGKFTLGLASAQSFVRAIRDSLPPRKGLVPNPVSRRKVASMVGPSPYFGIQTHYLEKDSNGSLRFKSRLM